MAGVAEPPGPRAVGGHAGIRIAGGSSGARRRRVPLVLALVLTAAVRVVFLVRDNTLSADEAVTGVMAQNISAGSRWYVFFAGQNYNSAVEQYPQALLFTLGAPQDAFWLRIPELVMNVISCALVYQVGRRLFNDSWRPGLAALLFAVGPIFQITRGSVSTGSYTTQLALGLLTVLCALSLRPELTRRRRVAAAVLIGLALTGTFYLTASGYFLVLPAVVWAVPSLLRLHLVVTALCGVVAGSAVPALYWVTHRSSFFPQLGIRASTPTSRLGDLLDPVGRMFLGLAHSAGAAGVPIGLARILLWVAVLALVAAIVIRRRSIVALLWLRPAGRRPLDVMLVAVTLAMGGYVASRYAYFTIDPRYLYATSPGLILLLAALADPAALGRLGKPVTSAAAGNAGGFTRVGVAAVSALLLFFIGGPTAVMLRHSSLDSNGNTSNLPNTGIDSDMAAAIKVLSREGTRYVFAAYWQAVPMDFLAQGRLTAVSYGAQNRFPEQRAEADAAPMREVAWMDLSFETAMAGALARHHIGYRARRFGHVTVYDQFSVSTDPGRIGLKGP